MSAKFSRFDISNFPVKSPEKFLPPALPQSEKPKPRHRRKSIVPLAWFALGAVAIVALLQGASYLSGAKHASGEILGAATNAYSDLNNAGQNLSQQNFSQAEQLFSSASTNVKLAQDKLDNYKVLTFIAPQASSADHILAGAADLASAGEKLSSALSLFDQFKVSSRGVETGDFGQKLSANKDLLTQTRDSISQASDEFGKAGAVPLDYEGTLDKAKQQVAQLGTILDKMIGLENLYLSIFGQPRTYLLIFQNYDEERATGGFIGTYGVLKTNHGEITELKIDSIYDLDGKIYAQIAAPGPFQPDIPRWGIRDANWFADFPTSAQKLLYFFEKGGETADGVISTTPKIFEDILRLTGPIPMSAYGVTLTPENFQETVQYETSVAYNRKLNEPKKMLSDFAPVLLDKLSSMGKADWFSFFQIMQDNLNQRQVLVYSKDSSAEKSIDDLGFSGKILPTDYDYLSIVNSNLGGTKTDLSMHDSVRLKSKILSDGTVLNTLTIDRKNSAQEKNRDYMRILVPLHSQLISASGFDDELMYKSEAKNLRTDPDLAAWDQGQELSNVFVHTEAEKTEFAGWLNTQPGEQKTITLTYILPFTLRTNHFDDVQSYSLLLQKQAGSVSLEFTANLDLGGAQSQWASSGVSRVGSLLTFGSNTNVDDFWGFVISK